MVRFIDDHREVYGVEPICRVVPIAPSTYFQWKAWEADPESRSKRAREDDGLKAEIRRVREENRHVYGAEKVWKELRRQEIEVSRCRVERLMREMGLVGVTRGRTKVFTTTPDDQSERPLDLVNRDFQADGPNQLWVSDLTYVATSSGFAYAAFVVDVYSRRIVGWCVSDSLSTDLPSMPSSKRSGSETGRGPKASYTIAIGDLNTRRSATLNRPGFAGVMFLWAAGPSTGGGDATISGIFERHKRGTHGESEWESSAPGLPPAASRFGSPGDPATTHSGMRSS
jgi:arginine repressor